MRTRPSTVGTVRAGMLAISLALHARASAAEEGVVQVVIDGEARGDYRFVRTDAGEFLFAAEDLLAMGFVSLPPRYRGAQADALVPLDAFAPPVQAEFVEKTSTLVLSADPRLLGRSTVDLASRPPIYERLAPAKAAGFFNYSVTSRAVDPVDTASVMGVGELGVNVGGTLALSGMSYLRDLQGDRIVRGMTYVTRDDLASNRRLVVGDAVAYSGTMGSGATLAGFQLSRNFSMTPFLNTYPGLDVSGILSTPSDVELYVNDLLVRKERFRPGEFVFENVPGIFGAGDVTLVIRDAFGREQRIANPVYVGSQLLEPGLHEYSYGAGFVRKQLGTRSFDYGGPAFLAFHRVGLSAAATAGFRAEADADTVNGGPTATLKLGTFGELDTGVALSHDAGHNGWGVASSYGFYGRNASARVSLRAFSRDYARLSLAESDDKPRVEASVTLGARHERLGSVSATHTTWDRYVAGRSHRSTVYYSRMLGRMAALTLSASRVDEQRVGYEFVGAITMAFGNRVSGGVRAGLQDGAAYASTTVQRNPTVGPGFGYRVTAETARADLAPAREVGGDASFEYRGPVGLYTAEYQRETGRNGYALTMAGAVAVIDGSAFLSRPIQDAFALVEIRDVDGVRVRLYNEEVGRTGRDGKLIVPGLVSYFPSNISIDERDIPVDHSIDRVTRWVAVPYRGGAVVSFAARKLRALVGHAIVLEAGARVVPEFWGLEISAGDRSVVAVVGRGGELYIEDVPPGRHRARFYSGKRECTFELDVPASDEMFVDLGEVTCEAH